MLPFYEQTSYVFDNIAISKFSKMMFAKNKNKIKMTEGAIPKPSKEKPPKEDSNIVLIVIAVFSNSRKSFLKRMLNRVPNAK